jgi:hypothetical protein
VSNSPEVWSSEFSRAFRQEDKSERASTKSCEERKGKIKGGGASAAPSRCLHIGFCSTSKIATVLPRYASY